MSRAFIAFYMGDYDRDTGHLSTLEHGAYFLLLKHCWVHGSIPLDQLSRGIICKLSGKKWHAIRHKLEPFFDEFGRNKRATKEIEKAEKTMTRQTMAGHRGAAKRWKHDSHGQTMVNSHGHGSSDGHGLAIKNNPTTSSSSLSAREGSAADPAFPVTPELAATIQKKRWVSRC